MQDACTSRSVACKSTKGESTPGNSERSHSMVVCGIRTRREPPPHEIIDAARVLQTNYRMLIRAGSRFGDLGEADASRQISQARTNRRQARSRGSCSHRGWHWRGLTQPLLRPARLIRASRLTRSTRVANGRRSPCLQGVDKGIFGRCIPQASDASLFKASTSAMLGAGFSPRESISPFLSGDDQRTVGRDETLVGADWGRASLLRSRQSPPCRPSDVSCVGDYTRFRRARMPTRCRNSSNNAGRRAMGGQTA